MSAIMTKINQKAAELRKTMDKETEEILGEIDMNVRTGFTLADAMRAGATVTDQSVGTWGTGDTACALTAAVVGAKSVGYLS